MLQHFQGCVITKTPNWDTGLKINSTDTQQSAGKHDSEKRHKNHLSQKYQCPHQVMYWTVELDNGLENARIFVLALSLPLEILLFALLSRFSTSMTWVFNDHIFSFFQLCLFRVEIPSRGLVQPPSSRHSLHNDSDCTQHYTTLHDIAQCWKSKTMIQLILICVALYEALCKLLMCCPG